MMPKDLSSYIDHTLLNPLATYAEVRQVVMEAQKYQFASACIPPYFLPFIKEEFGNKVTLATVVGFPFGYSHYSAKKQEIIQALHDGADEIDMVANITAIKNGDWRVLKTEIHQCITPIRGAQKIIKVIIESGMLTHEEIIQCCELYGAYQIDYLKTSTGYAAQGASVEAIELFRKHLPESVGIKASGGIRNRTSALAMIEKGATRIGASASLEIIKL